MVALWDEFCFSEVWECINIFEFVAFFQVMFH